MVHPAHLSPPIVVRAQHTSDGTFPDVQNAVSFPSPFVDQNFLDAIKGNSKGDIDCRSRYSYGQPLMQSPRSSSHRRAYAVLMHIARRLPPSLLQHCTHAALDAVKDREKMEEMERLNSGQKARGTGLWSNEI